MGLGQRGGLGGLRTPLVVLCAGGMCNTLLLLPAPQVGSWKLDFWSFCILFINCPERLCMQLFLVPCYFLFCWRRGLSRYKHCSKGSQPVSLPLLKTFHPQSHHLLQSSLSNVRPHSLFLSQTNQGQILVPS